MENTQAQAEPKWTPQKVERLKALLAEGLSATQTGDKLTGEGFGDTTRNAVLGKVHRLGLSRMLNVAPSRPKSPAVPPRPKACRQRPLSFGSGILRAPTLQLAPLAIETLQPGPEGGVPFLELNTCECRFPLGGFHDAPEKFCGAKTAFDAQYCSRHLAIAYVKPRRNDGTQSKPFVLQNRGTAA